MMEPNSYSGYILLFIIIIVVFIIIRKSGNATGTLLGGNIPVSNVLSHWSHFFQSFAMSSELFYAELQKTLQAHDMPHVQLSKTRHKEGGILSAGREYLRIKHGDIVFDVCAAPFGKDFFISWWLYETAGTMRTMLRNTKVGNFMNERASKRTFYQIDEEDMFRSCVHDCILETITKVSEGKGVTMLTDADKAFKMGGL
jgi:hypothetical protein